MHSITSAVRKNPIVYSGSIKKNKHKVIADSTAYLAKCLRNAVFTMQDGGKIKFKDPKGSFQASRRVVEVSIRG